jgi:hypothetical protein
MLLTTQRSLAGETGVGRQTVRTVLAHLVESQEITQESTQVGTLITIVNYETYQSDREDANPEANPVINPALNDCNYSESRDLPIQSTHCQPSNQPTANPLPTHNNSPKKQEKKKEKSGTFIPPTLEQVKDYIREHPEYSNIDPGRFLSYFTESDWVDSRGQKVKNWKLKLQTWSGFHPATGKATEASDGEHYNFDKVTHPATEQEEKELCERMGWPYP